jgi:hypothetical protein
MLDVHNINTQQRLNIDTILLNDEDVITNTPHCHDFWELAYFEKGSGIHTVDFVAHQIQDNLLYFLPKGTVNNMHCKKQSF